MEHYIVLYNPCAGGGRGEENAHKLEGLLPRSAVRFYDMTQIESYPAFFRSIPQGYGIVISGGDGTLNRFVNDIAGMVFSHTLYYYPGGTGNDFLRDVGAAENTLIELAPYLNHLPRVTVGGQTYRFINGIGYGIDGYCCQVGDEMRKRSSKPVNYTAIAIKGLLFHFKPVNAVVTVDGQAHTFRKVWLAPTMNGRYYGGGMMPTPSQDRLDPEHKVSTMVFGGSGKLKTLCIFPSIFKGTHVTHKKQVTVLTGQDITVKFDRPTALQIDGETVLGVTSYHVTAACAAQETLPAERQYA